MSGLRFSIESLKLSLTGFSPETARLALEGLDRELELRLQRRRMSRGFSMRMNGSAGGASAGGLGTGGGSGAANPIPAPMDSRVPMNAAALRGLIADKLLEAMEAPGAGFEVGPATEGGRASSGGEG